MKIFVFRKKYKIKKKNVFIFRNIILYLNINSRKTGEGDSKIGEYLPHFYWVLRDFSLDLKGKTPK